MRCGFKRRPASLIIAGAALSLLTLFASCHRHSKKAYTIQELPAADSQSKAFPYLAQLTPSSAPLVISSSHELMFAQGERTILLFATGDDPYFTFRASTTNPGPVALAVDIDSPAVTKLELYYQTSDARFSSSHVLRAALRSGRNRLFFEVNDPGFTGALRLDPGELPGRYLLHELDLFSTQPVTFVRRTRPQQELAAAFAEKQASLLPSAGSADDSSTFSFRKPAELARITPLRDVNLKTDAGGLEIEATGDDPSLILPIFTQRPVLVKVSVVSPEDTFLQLFYKLRGQIEYDQAHSYIQTIKKGDNTVYLEHAQPEWNGELRFDPGTVPGRYLLKEISFVPLEDELPRE